MARDDVSKIWLTISHPFEEQVGSGFIVGAENATDFHSSENHELQNFTKKRNRVFRISVDWIPFRVTGLEESCE